MSKITDAPAAPGADAELLHAGERFQQITRQLGADAAADTFQWAENEAVNEQWWAMLRALIDLPACTPAGLRAKAGAALVAMSQLDNPDFDTVAPADRRLAESVLRDVMESAFVPASAGTS